MNREEASQPPNPEPVNSLSLKILNRKGAFKMIQNYKEFLKNQNSSRSYLITGVKLNGERFRIVTATPEHYNIYRGSVWLLTESGKKLIRRIYN